MNADHQDSLIVFVEYYCRVPTKLALDATLEDLERTHLIIQCKAGRLYIPLDPPLKSWSEARERMIEMHHAAFKGLGRSEISVSEYVPPASLSQALVFTAVTVAFIAFSRRANFESGSILHQLVLYKFPGFEKLCYTLQPYVIVFMMVIHTTESIVMDRTRLRKHGVKTGTGLWWKWMISCFFEGFFSFRRFDELVKAKTDAKGSH
ncbi:MAG: hypothetical protein Q9227_002572 [Pyrenula ochraceoflavens]